MKKFMDWLANSFAPKANALLSRPWLAGISASMTKIIPFILTGSLVYLYNVLRLVLPGLPDLGIINQYSFKLIAIIIAFTVTNQLMEKLNDKEYTINASIASVCLFLMFATPMGDDSNSFSAFLGNVGPTGLVVGIVTGIFVAWVFHMWAKVKFLKDSAIPDFIVGWINVIIPFLVCLFTGMILTQVFKLNIVNLLLAAFAPIAGIAETLPGFILFCFVPAFFYTIGCSSWLLEGVTYPIYLTQMQANMDQIAAGGVATNIATYETVFGLGYICMGGMCATLVLNVMFCFSKSAKLKTMGKIFLPTSIFNINEPIVYGAPIIFNPILMLPAWIVTVVGAIYTWVLMKTGMLAIPPALFRIGQIPSPISGVMMTHDWRALIWWAILVVIYTVIWYPFFKVFEKETLEEEKAVQGTPKTEKN